jgi:SNF2 family DNA or RNA helicase
MVISLCLINRCSPTLIVCPSSVLNQWKTEFTKFVREDHQFSTLSYHGDDRKNKTVADVRKYEIVFTTYDTLKARGDKSKNPDADISETVLQEVDWHRVILDECQYIKNTDSDRFKAAAELLAYSRWILSATPIQNDISDMHSYFLFLKCSPMEPVELFQAAVAAATVGPYHGSSLQRHFNSMCLRRGKGTACSLLVFSHYFPHLLYWTEE